MVGCDVVAHARYSQWGDKRCSSTSRQLHNRFLLARCDAVFGRCWHVGHRMAGYGDRVWMNKLYVIWMVIFICIMYYWLYLHVLHALLTYRTTSSQKIHYNFNLSLSITKTFNIFFFTRSLYVFYGFVRWISVHIVNRDDPRRFVSQEYTTETWKFRARKNLTKKIYLEHSEWRKYVCE